MNYHLTPEERYKKLMDEIFYVYDVELLWIVTDDWSYWIYDKKHDYSTLTHEDIDGFKNMYFEEFVQAFIVQNKKNITEQILQETKNDEMYKIIQKVMEV